MKKYVIIASALSLFLAGNVGLAQASMMGNYNSANINTQQTPTLTIAVALEDIYASQGVSNQNEIDCTKISDTQFEKLGDAYMASGITQAQHTAMENMMGGEGSATLQQVHIAMGRAYLGCWSGSSTPQKPMMSMMNNNFPANAYPVNYNSRNGMMNWYSTEGDYYGVFGIFSWVTMVLVWVLLISGILALWKHIKSKK